MISPRWKGSKEVGLALLLDFLALRSYWLIEKEGGQWAYRRGASQN